MNDDVKTTAIHTESHKLDSMFEAVDAEKHTSDYSGEAES